ncbi:MULTISPECIES: ApeA N-terminal domain 1-containing protein [unclassified Xanthomonas]|uniref:ApeA N-terminal domain 1-containing protein n=1 Tax=Xanthomonas sp. LMG 8992 TaxID=1591157 RepID=UPI00136B718D|nr:HEPN domain-containing protein [Xanthomonas sp. LMG 8992]
MKETDAPQSLLGRFWLPTHGEDTAVSGVLDFNDAGATVRLEGALTPTGLLANAIVFARLQGRHEKATLFNCFASARKRGDGTVVSSKIESTRIALGSLREDLGGRGVQFRLPGSPAWFHEQCFYADIGDQSEAVVRFKAFESAHYPLSDELTLERFYSATVPFGNWGSEQFHVDRPMGFRIVSSRRLDFDRLWAMMHRLRRFLEFLSQQHLPPTHLMVFDEAEIERGIPDLEVRHSSLHAVKPKKFEWDDQLVRFDDIQDRFPILLVRWFEAHQAYPEPFDRYFAAFDRSREDVILHFLWNVAALEELHKLRTTRVTKKEFSLLERLRDISTRWSAAFKAKPPDDILRQIKDSRHYYAHAAGDLRHKAAKDWTLLRYGDFVAALSNLEILSLLGLSEEDALRLANNYWMSETLSLNKYPTQRTDP